MIKLETLFQLFLLHLIALYVLLLVDFWWLDQLWWQQYGWLAYAGLFFGLSATLLFFWWRFLSLRRPLQRWPELMQVVLYTMVSAALLPQLFKAPLDRPTHPVLVQVVEKLGAPATSDFSELVEGELVATEAAVPPQVVTTVVSGSPAPPADPWAGDPDLAEANWGEAVKVSDTGYRMKVGFDDRMGTADETFQALNTYRYTKGKSNLTWDDRLATYARQRAAEICANGSDGHAGFDRYVNEEEGYKTLGFYKLGENMSTYMRLTGVHLIEWMYAASPSHDANQLGDWSHVGVGIADDCSVLIFGNWMI
jgi:uncharacterized protein YkwD